MICYSSFNKQETRNKHNINLYNSLFATCPGFLIIDMNFVAFLGGFQLFEVSIWSMLFWIVYWLYTFIHTDLDDLILNFFRDF